jgi:hypothetical protein
MDGRPHGNVRQLVGDSRGHWDGDTLVVDTTNFTAETWRGSCAGLAPRRKPPRTQRRSDMDPLRHSMTWSIWIVAWLMCLKAGRLGGPELVVDVRVQ